MYMMQNIEKSRHKQLERKAREDRRRALALQTGKSEEELRSKETQLAQERTASEAGPAPAKPEPVKPDDAAPAKEKSAKKSTPKAEPAKEESDDVFDFEEEDDDLF